MKLRNKIWRVKQKTPKIKKRSKGFKFHYANLEDVEKALKPIIEEEKIGYVHSLRVSGTNNILTTKVFDLDNEDSVDHELVIPNGVELAGMNAFQALGSAISYYKRYHLTTIFGIITGEDVDAVTPKVKKVSVNHVEKVQQLIQIGRAKSTLEKYFQTYTEKMSEEERNEIRTLIKDLK